MAGVLSQAFRSAEHQSRRLTLRHGNACGGEWHRIEQNFGVDVTLVVSGLSWCRNPKKETNHDCET